MVMGGNWSFTLFIGHDKFTVCKFSRTLFSHLSLQSTPRSERASCWGFSDKNTHEYVVYHKAWACTVCSRHMHSLTLYNPSVSPKRPLFNFKVLVTDHDNFLLLVSFYLSAFSSLSLSFIPLTTGRLLLLPQRKLWGYESATVRQIQTWSWFPSSSRSCIISVVVLKDWVLCSGMKYAVPNMAQGVVFTAIIVPRH